MARVGQQGSFNHTVGVKQDVDEAIVILPVDDVPLQRWLPSESTNSIKVEWLEEDLTPQTATVASVVGTASPWTVTLSTDVSGGNEATLFRVGDILAKADADEAYNIQFRVDSVNAGANTVVLTSFGGSTDSNDPAATEVLELIGQYRDEGSDPEDARSIERRTAYNYTQFGQEKVEVTRTQRKRAMFAQTDPYDHEVGKKFKELAIRYERSLVKGVRTFSGDSKRRFMGGVLYYLSTNAESTTAAAVKTGINNLSRKCYNQGGTPRTLMVSPSIKQVISANIDPTLRRTERSDTVGGFVVEKILTDFGTIEVVVNRHFPVRKGVLFQREFVKRKVFDGYFHELLAKTGDAEKGQLVGELSLEVKNEKAHGVLTVSDAA